MIFVAIIDNANIVISTLHIVLNNFVLFSKRNKKTKIYIYKITNEIDERDDGVN